MTVAIDKYKNINDQQVKLWSELYCKEASNAEIKLFLNLCDKTGMSPEARQIYMIDRWDSKNSRMVKTPMFSIEAFRLIAERSHKYAGQVGAWWCGADGVWKDVWLSDKPPAAAKVGVLRSDFKEPLFAVATYNSYCQTTKSGSPTQTWTKMPDVMLAKCAESLALRKAFSQDLSGLYTIEEMRALPETDSNTIEAEVINAKIETSQLADNATGIPKKTAKKSSVKEGVSVTADDIDSINSEKSSEKLEIFDVQNPVHLDRLGRALETKHIHPSMHETVAAAMAGKPMSVKAIDDVIKNIPIM